MKEQIFSNAVKFHPFVGNSYENNAFGKRIMVLGDSHYGTTPSTTITQDVMKYYLEPDHEREGWMNTYTKFERSLVNKETTTEDSRVIWNSLVFYNYLQELLSGPREAGSDQQYADSAVAFYEVLEVYKPEILIVWGKRLWHKLPDENWEEGETVKVDDYEVDNGRYLLSDGSKVKAFCVYHPSTGYDWSYWYKVISKFINSDGTTPTGIDSIGFTNFKRFRRFPKLNLGKINIFVGANNAGKSTFTKGTMIFIDFLKRWFLKGDLVIDFASELCRSLNISNYKDALNYSAYAKYGDAITFKAKIGRYAYEAEFVPTEYLSTENTADSTDAVINVNTSRVSARKITVIDTEDNSSEYTFFYDKSENTIEAEAQTTLFSPSEKTLTMLEGFLNSPRCSVDTGNKEAVYNHLDDVRESINNSDNFAEAAKHLSEAEAIIGEDIPNDIKQSLNALKSALRQLANYLNTISIRFTLPRTATIKDFFEKLKTVNDIQPELDESRRNNIMVRLVDFCPMVSLQNTDFFTIRDNDSVSLAVRNYYQALQTMSTSHIKFVEKWLTEFNIGQSIIINNFEEKNVAYSCDIKQTDGKIIDLSTLGSGAIHLTTLIMTLVNMAVRNGSMAMQTIFVEEPEMNLHPCWQTKLADFFFDFQQTFGVQFIIETHSEYIVRKTQVLVAHQKYHSDEELKAKNPFKVFYFDKDDERKPYYDLGFDTDGFFRKPFGTGFYDEASNIHLELH